MKVEKAKEEKNLLKGINNYTLYFLQLLAFGKGQNRLELPLPSKKHCNENSDFFCFKGLLCGWGITVNLCCQDSAWTHIWLYLWDTGILDVNEILPSRISFSPSRLYAWFMSKGIVMSAETVCFSRCGKHSLHSEDHISAQTAIYFAVQKIQNGIFHAGSFCLQAWSQ